LLCEDARHSAQAIEQIMRERAFGEAGGRVVVEEWLRGEEASFLVFTDGETIVPMPSSQDHKAVGDGDTGPNTGGMGAYSPAPVVTPAVQEKVMDRVIRPMIQGMAKEGTPFKGILYAGLMIDEFSDPRVLEFNVRFGDPECQPLMVRLESDLADIMLKLSQGRLSEAKVKWSDKVSVCVVLASGGYPGSYPKGKAIKGIQAAEALGEVVVFHAGTGVEGDRLVTAGGRVLGVTALGDDVAAAIDLSYRACDLISWDGMYLRKDIGHRALARLQESCPQVGVVMGSDSDWKMMRSAVKVLKSLGVGVEARVLSAHRTPDAAAKFAKEAKARGIKVIIAGAGWAAHLAGAMAAWTTLPIIGVPLDSSPLAGMDSLLSTVQMPPGMPVATVAIGSGGAKNAGILAAQIIALGDPELSERIVALRGETADKVLAADQTLRSTGDLS
jgi:phosphoribosylamine--glycine ligase